MGLVIQSQRVWDLGRRTGMSFGSRTPLHKNLLTIFFLIISWDVWKNKFNKLEAKIIFCFNFHGNVFPYDSSHSKKKISIHLFLSGGFYLTVVFYMGGFCLVEVFYMGDFCPRIINNNNNNNKCLFHNSGFHRWATKATLLTNSNS